jgi:hypothetical protein
VQDEPSDRRALASPPSPSAGDRTREIIKAAAGEFPIAGTVVTALYELFGTSYEERQHAWLVALHATVSELEHRGLEFEQIARRADFITAVHEASRIALGTHLESKLDMLKNVLVSAATAEIGRNTELRALRFLALVDDLEPEHIIVLRRCQASRFGALSLQEQSDAFEALDLDRTDLELLMDDLASRGLLANHYEREPLREWWRRKGTPDSRQLPRRRYLMGVTALGVEFLEWLHAV